MEWVIRARGVRNGQWSVQRTLTVCSELEDTCKWFHKCVGPLTFITFLGTEVDIALELRLPGEKMEELGQLITDWQGRKCFKKNDLRVADWLSIPCL